MKTVEIVVTMLVVPEIIMVVKIVMMADMAKIQTGDDGKE